MSTLLPIAPQSIIQLFKTAGQIWKATIIPTFFFYLLMFGASHLIDMYKLVYPPAALALAGQGQGSPTILFISLLLILIGAFFTLSFYTSIIFRINNIVNQQDQGFGPSATYGFRRFFPTLAVGLLYGLLSVLGLLLLIIPGIIFMVYFCFSLYFVMLGKGVFESMQESSNLVKEHWWRTAFVIVLLYIPVILFFIALVVVIAAAGITDKNVAQILANTSATTLISYFILLYVAILIPITHYMNSFFLSYFYDLHNRKKVTAVPV